MKRIWAMILLIGVAAAAGCGNGDKTTMQKRDYDRTMMQLSEAQKENEELRSAITQARAAQSAAESRATAAQKELDTTRAMQQQAIESLHKQLDEIRAAMPATRPAPPPMNK